MNSKPRLFKAATSFACGCAIALMTFAGSHQSIAAAASPGRETFGFAPYWNLWDQSEWNYNLVKTFGYFAVAFDGSGNINAGYGGYQDLGNGNFNAMMASAHAAGDRVLLTVSGDSGLVTNGSAVTSVVNQTLQLVQQYHFNGVMVDLEGSTNGCGDLAPQRGLTSLLEDFRNAMNGASLAIPNSELMVSSYSGSASWNCGYMNVHDLAQYVDAFFIMAYDMADSNQGYMCGGPNAPMTNWTYNDTMALYGTGSQPGYLSAGEASPNQVILGVPYYGYKCNVSSPSAYARATSGATADTYSGILGDLSSCAGSQMTLHWDSIAEEPWATWYSGSGGSCGGNNSWRELYYENAQSLCFKYNLVQTANIRGAGVWALGYDAGNSDLWNQMNASFGNGNTVKTGCGIATPTGTLARYDQGGVGHWVTTGSVSSDYALGNGHEEFALGTLSLTYADGLQPVYSCQAGSVHFLSLGETCEGQVTLQIDGYSSIANPGNYVQLFRCRATPNNDHFASLDPNCEGQTPEGSLGFIDPSITVTRYFGGGGHVSLSGAAPAGFVGEQQFTGFSSTTGTPIFDCRAGSRSFTSTDAKCEGQVEVGILGLGSSAPGAGLVPLYRCDLPSSGDHYDTTSSGCEGAPGAIREYVLTYVKA